MIPDASSCRRFTACVLAIPKVMADESAIQPSSVDSASLTEKTFARQKAGE
jgi:hypothetical protein